MHERTRRVALSGMLCALAEVFLLLGGLVPIAVYACPILAMLTLLPVREECGTRLALVAYAAAALLALMLVPDRELACVYLFFGWYPAAQPYLDRIPSRALRLVVKLTIFILTALALYASLLFVFQLDAVAAEFAGYSRLILAVLAVMGCGTFLLTDLLLHRMAALWHGKLRRRWFRGSR